MSRIVLVVREPAQALAWRNVLVAGCHEVVAVTNAARSARGLLTQHQPQLVLCELRLSDGTALAMIQWLAALPQRPLIVAVADDDDPLMVEALRAGADNVCGRATHAETLLTLIDQTLRGETALSTSLAHALLDHFERARMPRHHALLSIGDEQSPLQLEPAQRDLLMRLAAGYRSDQVAAACRLSVGELGRRLRAIVRKLQWDVRAGALTLQLA